MENDNSNVLTFEFEGKYFAIDLLYIRSIIEIPKIKPLPMVDRHICGIINLRGKIVPVMDFAMKLGFEPPEYDNRSCIIVLDCNGLPLGLKVKKIAGIEKYEIENVSKSPVEDQFVTGYININGKNYALLDNIKLSDKNL